MPAWTHKTEGGARVLLHTCETCGAPAPFGRGVSILKALHARSPEEARRHCGEWFCGWRDGAPACIGKGNPQNDLFAGR